MSRYHTWLESLRKAEPVPKTIRFQHGDGSDYELPLEAALTDEEPPGGMRCVAVIGQRESIFTVPRSAEPKEDAGSVKTITAVAKSVADATAIGLTQVVPVMQDLREGIRSLIEENGNLRSQLNGANQLAVDRSLQSVLVTAQEKATQARAESIDKLIGLGYHVANGVLHEVSRAKTVKQTILRLSPATLEQVKRDLGDEEFATLVETLFPEQIERIRTAVQRAPTTTSDEVKK